MSATTADTRSRDDPRSVPLLGTCSGTELVAAYAHAEAVVRGGHGAEDSQALHR